MAVVLNVSNKQASLPISICMLRIKQNTQKENLLADLYKNVKFFSSHLVN